MILLRRFAMFTIVILLLTISIGHTQTCTFSWDKVTKYTNNVPITDVVTYRLYYQKGTDAATLFIATTETSVTAICDLGTYWVTAVTNKSMESDKSSTATLPKPAKVNNFKGDRK